jgi:APA family basic amino acid/polyamine antiporter
MPENLSRTFSLRDLITIVIGTVIGSGIFIVPAVVLRMAEGNIGLALLAWLLAGVLSLLGALTYGELGAMAPESGGLYVYLRDAYGSLPAFLYGWTLFFIISSGSVATLAVAFASYLNQLLPLDPLLSRGVALLMIVTVAAINVRGTRKSVGVQNWTTAIKVGAILIMGAALLTLGKGFAGSDSRLWPESISLPLLSGIGLAMVGVLWAYEGWQYLTFSAGEAINPQRTFARGIGLGTAALIGIYLFANVAYFAAMGPHDAAQSERIAADAVGVTVGPAAGKLIAVAILVSMFSAANGVTLTTSRVYFAMARDGVFFRRLAEIHPRFGTPALAIVWSSACAVILAATGTFEELLTYVVFTGWIFYALGAMSIFVYRRRHPEAHRPFRVPGYPFTPILFVLSAAAIVANTLVSQPQRALVGIAVVLIGTPAFYLWKAKSAHGEKPINGPT